MSYSVNELNRIQKATGLEIGLGQINAIFNLQSPIQKEQFIEDLKKVVFIYEESVISDGRIQEKYTDEWAQSSERIGIWYSYHKLLEPKRSGWFRKKEISFGTKLLLSQVLSPDAPIRKTGILDI